MWSTPNWRFLKSLTQPNAIPTDIEAQCLSNSEAVESKRIADDILRQILMQDIDDSEFLKNEVDPGIYITQWHTFGTLESIEIFLVSCPHWVVRTNWQRQIANCPYKYANSTYGDPAQERTLEAMFVEAFSYQESLQSLQPGQSGTSEWIIRTLSRSFESAGRGLHIHWILIYYKLVWL